MKKLLSIAVAVFLVVNSFAQNEEYRSTISVNAGFSLVGGLIDAMGAAPSLGDTYQTESYSIPALQVNYDLGLAKWFSIGAALSYQAMGIDYTNWEYIDDNGDWQTIDFSAKIGRTNAALRFLFHYANQDRIDLYQGVRVGYLMWNTKTEVSETVFDPETDLDLNFGRPSVQLVLFGMRGYVTENIGLSTELAIGAPHFLTVGANYRF